MLRNFQVRFTAVLLAFLTLASVVLAVMNYVRESNLQIPTDGILWTSAQGGLVVQQVLPGGPGERAGIEPADLLISVDDLAIPNEATLQQQLMRSGTYTSVTYTIARSGIQMDVPVILVPKDRSINPGLRLIALVYLLIGLYVLFRRWTAPRATHFYIFCLTSFILYTFIGVGRLSVFDWIISWGNVLAAALQPALLLHFSLTFPEEKAAQRKQRWMVGLAYFPSTLLIALNLAAIWLWPASEAFYHSMNQAWLIYLACFYVLASVVFFLNYRRANNPLMRQQLKWLTRGTLIAVVPFTLFYVVPYLAGASTDNAINHTAVLCLVLLPLTFSYAIVRYRLMDVDLIFKRGVTYTLATAALVGLYFGAVAIGSEVVHTRLPAAGGWGLAAAITIFALLFDPMKRAIQDRVDRVFDRKRYDYRETLIEFARDLNSQTNLQTLLDAILDRLPRTLLVARIAVFLAAENSPTDFSLAAAQGIPPSLRSQTATLDLSFLQFDPGNEATHIFLENPQNAPHLTPTQQRTVRQLDLNYYLPCLVQRRPLAVLGLGRTTGGDFLSSEDVELLETLASYIGIAIQNAQLYASLEQKISEYEQLKDFNENIVESINIGILAVDLEDRIDGWNAQMESMYAVPRAEALRQPLSSLFPPDFIAEYARVKNDPGVHTLYKFRLVTRSGDVRTANITLAPLLDKDQAAVGRIILMDDITERVQLEAQLMQADKLSSIGLLAAGVAHEVNTPLAVISSYTQMLSKQVRDDERLSQMLHKITQQTFRASEIVNGLLNFSRTSGTEFAPLNMNTVLQETLTLLEHQFRTAGIRIQLDLDASLPEILGHTGKLQQVFLNLFLNAKDAMTNGGVLHISTEANGHVSVVISDSGSGIAQENLRRIYDPFFTTKSAVREGQRRGTGLGLAVSYGIIQEHAGKIHVESELGHGTTFHLEFPVLRKAVHA